MLIPFAPAAKYFPENGIHSEVADSYRWSAIIVFHFYSKIAIMYSELLYKYRTL